MKSNQFALSTILISALVLSVLISLMAGAVWINPFDNSSLLHSIILQIRLPRIILSGLVGAMLALSGAILQAVLKNDLSDPYILGISSGGALGAAIAIICSLPMAMVSFNAFIFSFAAVIVVFFIAKTGGRTNPSSLILAGVAVSSFTGAVLGLLITSSDRLQSIYFWMMGSFSGANWEQINISCACLALGLIVAMGYSRQMNAFLLGEEEALSLGVDTTIARAVLLCAASLLAGVSVSFCGIIGFAGLMVPHMIRVLSGPNYFSLIPLSALAGALLLILADTASRIIFIPSEIPVGIITALVGAPFFIYLLKRGAVR
ncbi:MAG: iron ABC transporter permease [Candidatus Margulisiibacteriota bacterium]